MKMNSSEIYGDEAHINKKPRYAKVEENELKLPPHNCIGLIRLKGMGGKPSEATGTLISNSLVLTSAHSMLFNYNRTTRKFIPY